jgi:hypothetical protein
VDVNRTGGRMALQRNYDDRFEKYIWSPYPKWPTGRSRKELAFKAYQAANRILKFTLEDLEAIRANIEERKRYCATWQKGNKFGPVGCQVYLNQMLWNEPYERTKDTDRKSPTVPQNVWQRMGYADEESYYRGERMH